MLKGFAIIPTLLGRIAIGEIEEKNGKKLPKKLDHIQITGMAQGSDGGWAEHPEMTRLLEAQKEKAKNPASGITSPDKLRSIPVRIMFDSPGNNFRAEYSCFDQKGRPMCSGDGEKAKRRTAEGITDEKCPGHDICEFGKQNRCKPFGRLIVAIEAGFEKDPLAGYMFRTTSFNSIRALTARLSYLGALTGNKLSGLPCNLRMRAKSTSASFRKPIYYLDLEPADGLGAAVKAAAEYHKTCIEAGIDLTALDLAVKEGIEASAFFEDSQDGEEVVEEFYNTEVVDPETGEIIKPGSKRTAAAAQPSTTSSPESAEPAAELANPAQVKAVEALLQSTGRSLQRLMEWLGKPSDTEVAKLSSQDAARAIEAMTPKAEA